MIGLFDETGFVEAAMCDIVKAAAKLAFEEEKHVGSVEITLTTQQTIQAANKDFRAIDSVTDVLSFPTVEPGECPEDGFWGDILLCAARANEQALEYGHSKAREYAFLTIHGMLHLFGYDHIKKEDEACMQQKQRRILERMDLTL